MPVSPYGGLLAGLKVQDSGIPLFSVEKSPFLTYSMVEQAANDDEVVAIGELDKIVVRRRLLLDETMAVSVLLERTVDAGLSVDDVEEEVWKVEGVGP